MGTSNNQSDQPRNEESSNRTSRKQRWTEDTTAFFLAYLNVHIHDFRVDREQQLEFAAQHLEKRFGTDYGVELLKGKLKRLWATYGPNGSTSTDDLYYFGVSFATLPGIASLGEPFLRLFEQYVRYLRCVHKVRRHYRLSH